MTNKKGLIFLAFILSLCMLALALPQVLLPFISSDDSTSDVYQRVEANRYEIVLPNTVNDSYFEAEIEFDGPTHIINIGGFYSFFIDGYELINISILFNFSEGNVYSYSEIYEENPLSYGRYVISDIQVPDDPLSYQFFPVYDYVLLG